MHFPSELLLSHMGLAEAGMWAAHVNDDGQVVLVIKLATDTLKWIHRGVPVNLLIGHVQTEQALVRVLGLPGMIIIRVNHQPRDFNLSLGRHLFQQSEGFGRNGFVFQQFHSFMADTYQQI